MAAAKKSSKKKSSKSKRANACARGGSEMRTIKGTSPRSVRRRSKAAFDLVTCRKARPVKAKKRAPKKRASVKNGSVRMTMANVKNRNRNYHRENGDDFSYFDRKTSRFFGGDKFSGPYAGPGGVFFVQVNNAGVKIKQALPDGRIGNVYDLPDFRSIEDARDAAKALAKRG